MAEQSSEACAQDVTARVKECQWVPYVKETVQRCREDFQRAKEKLKTAETGFCNVDNRKRLSLSDLQETFQECIIALYGLRDDFFKHMEEHPVVGRGNAVDSGYCGSRTGSQVVSGTGFGMNELPPNSLEQPGAIVRFPIQEEGEVTHCSTKL